MVRFIEGCIGGAGIGFLIGLITMQVEAPYRFALIGLLSGGSLYCIFKKETLRNIILILATGALIYALNS